MIAAQFPKIVITTISICWIITGCAGISMAADYLVDSNSNNVDANPGDGICQGTRRIPVFRMSPKQ